MKLPRPTSIAGLFRDSSVDVPEVCTGPIMNTISGHKSKKNRTAKRFSEPALRLVPDVFSEEMVRRIVDECIIPAMVVDFLRTKKILLEFRKETDNKDP